MVGLNYANQKMYATVTNIIPDKKHDIAILEIGLAYPSKISKIDSTLYTPLFLGITSFASLNEIVDGQGVLIIGYPLGIGSEFTGNRPISRIGIVAQQPNNSSNTFIIDGVASHGNSGSPVFNSQTGKILGMISSFPADFISAYDENKNLIVKLPYNSSLSICITIDVINKLIP
jgi:hypothetical protein